MKISTRLAIVGSTCVLVALAIAVSLGLSGQHVAEGVRKNRAAADLVESVAGLRHLTLEYARQPEARVEVQWHSAYRTLGAALERAQGFDARDEQEGIAQIRAAYDKSPAVFAELVRAQRARQAGDGDRQVLDEWAGRLAAAMARKTLLMMSEAFRLQDLSREEVAAAQRRAFAIVLALSATLAVVVAGSMVLVFRDIARPLARLREGMLRVGAGDLEHAVGGTGSDEITELAREFDGMSALLRTTTVSRDRLAESEARTRLILDAALDAVVGIDGEGRITQWNPQAEAVFGWPAAEATGQSLADLIVPERFREAHLAGLRRYLDTGVATVLDRRVELRAVRRDGGEFPIELAITAIRANGVVSFNAFLRDITSRKLGEMRLKEQLARLNLLHQITRAVGERQDLRSIFQAVIRGLEDDAPVDFSCICLRDAASDTLRVTGVGVKSAPLALSLALSEQADLSIDGNGLSQCLAGRLVHEPDAAQVPFPFPQRLARGGLRSLVIAPLQSEYRVFGVLVAARRDPQAFSSSDCEFLQQLSEHVSLASHQAQLHGALLQAYEDLRQTQQAILQQERLQVPGQGACVSLRFAALAPEEGLAAPQADPDEKPPPLRILLVDDDPLLLRSLQETLEAEGHAVTAAHAGREGIEAFEAAFHAERAMAQGDAVDADEAGEGGPSGRGFQVVVTDLGMPHVDGRQVAAAVKALSPDTPVILLTGWGQRLVDDGEKPRHVDQVLGKPPKLREVRAALARLVERPSGASTGNTETSY